MKITIKTIYKGDYTIGKLYLNDIYFCDTLEDPIRDLNNDGDLHDIGEKKIWGDTAIPKGIYTVILSYSPKFKKILPRLLNVPNFDGILIHGGRLITTKIDTHGCILVGENKVKGQLINSKETIKNLIIKLLDSGDKKHVIEIIR